MPSNLLKLNPNFGGKYHLHLKDLGVSQAEIGPKQAANKFASSCTQIMNRCYEEGKLCPWNHQKGTYFWGITAYKSSSSMQHSKIPD